MAEDATLAAIAPVERSLNLIPVGLKEAALDSPTFRATAVHFSDQIDIIEKWLEGYVKAAQRLVAELSSLENIVNGLLVQSTPPAGVSEAVIDHDYSLFAMRRYGEGAREFWSHTIKGIRRYDGSVVDPIKNFLGNELKSFKDTRRTLDNAQKLFDTALARYMGQSKTKEASSLREDAFQVYEARARYLRASMDYCMAAPQLRSTLDKLIVRIFADQWKEMRVSRESSSVTFAKVSSEMERVRGWSREMENSERAFKRELASARKQIEGSAATMMKPSRDMDAYAVSTVPYLGNAPGMANGANSEHEVQSEKQGWLMLRSITGKPARTVWSRRWFYVKNGVFGWLDTGKRSGGVEESENIGVLLCSVRPAFQEERRFCFEVKTKDSSIVMQAETQAELTDWIAAFEMAKRKALEDPLNTDSQASGNDPAFAITAPSAPEFAAKTTEHEKEDSQDKLGIPGEREGVMPARASFEIASTRRITSLEKDSESSGSAARIISKLDLHKRGSTASPSISQGPAPGGGIASLISASHTILPVGPGAPPTVAMEAGRRTFTLPANAMPTSSLAPSTLANPPSATNLSHTAVVVSGERGASLGRSEGSGTPSAIMSNLWGSSNWGYLNRLADDTPEARPLTPARSASAVSQDDSQIMHGTNLTESPGNASPDAATIRHRKTLSATAVTSMVNHPPAALASFLVDAREDYPSYYPLPLRAQHAQFLMLFPSVPRSDKVVLVFRATWNPNEQQEFPGRIYVTTKDIYIYSNHLGLVLITGVSLSALSEVTAAPGRDCDFLYLHLKDRVPQDDSRRITVKVFLEPLRLLQRRLNFLVRNANAKSPEPLEDVLKALIKMETEPPQRSSSVESWEDIAYDADNSPMQNVGGSPNWPAGRKERNVRAALRIDGNLYGDPGAAKTGREIQKFKLPSQAVSYTPQGMQASITRDFNVSAKALFHVIFGDKSAVFQLLYCNRWADKIVQTPWSKGVEPSSRFTRQFFSSEGKVTPPADTQNIDVANDHLCYVVTNTKHPWRLPYSTRFRPMTKIVITHTAKSRCKLAIFQQIRWQVAPRWVYIRNLIEKQALSSLEADALDLTNVAMDQVAKLGSHSKTNRAIEIFGLIGQTAKTPLQIDVATVPNMGGSAEVPRVKQRKPFGIIRLVVDDIFVGLLGLVGWSIDLLMAVGKAIIGVCTAHTVLVALLAVSTLYNTWQGYRDGLVWWQDIRASRFMSRVGVKYNGVELSKAVYLRDIEDFIGIETSSLSSSSPLFQDVDAHYNNNNNNNNETSNTLHHHDQQQEPPPQHKTCRTTFKEQLTSSVSASSFRHQPSARLSRTRSSLAQYRHDLLVALRVVNRVEQDVVNAEYEDWVYAEVDKCARIEEMMTARDENSGSAGLKVEEALGKEFLGYCRDCREEVEGWGGGDL